MASATATLRAELERRAEQARTFLSRISIRLLAFNILLVFLPAAGLLTLDTYESQMLRTQEQAMVQQGRVLAAALGGPAGLDDAFGILRNLGGRQQARCASSTRTAISSPTRAVSRPSSPPPRSARRGRCVGRGRQALVERRAGIARRRTLLDGRAAVSSTPLADRAAAAARLRRVLLGRDELLGAEVEAALRGAAARRRASPAGSGR
jgi:hypothetical protein